MPCRYVAIYVFSIAGMTLFSGMELSLEVGVDHHTNFNNIYVSMQTVFQLVTGDAWSGFYLDALEVRYPSDKVGLSENWVHAYFIIFMFTMLILTAVFVAIIIKNYSIQRSLSIDQETVALFSNVWLRYDAKVSGYISVFNLGRLIGDLGSPLSPMYEPPSRLVRHRKRKEKQGVIYDPEIDRDFDKVCRHTHVTSEPQCTCVVVVRARGVEAHVLRRCPVRAKVL